MSSRRFETYSLRRSHSNSSKLDESGDDEQFFSVYTVDESWDDELDKIDPFCSRSDIVKLTLLAIIIVITGALLITYWSEVRAFVAEDG